MWLKIKVTRFDKQDARYQLIERRESVGIVNVRNGEVQDVEVREKYRRRGLATKLIQRVIEDFGGEELVLMAEAEEGISPLNLRRFYRKFGFVSDRSCHDYMVRKPQMAV